MPAITFGLGSKTKPPESKAARVGQKRKHSLFGEDGDGNDVKPTSLAEEVTVLGNLYDSGTPPPKSPRLEDNSTKSGRPPQQYTNLSALHSAQKYSQEATTVDSTMYDYDGVYDSFQTGKRKLSEETKGSGPKYMTNLLKSAEVRKRDQLRAKERLLQKERDAEGDEYADKEKFVTGAYKAQQEEIRKLEESEAAQEAAEEEKRRKGGGMTGFYKDLLKKDEQRSMDISTAEEAIAKNPKVTDDVEEQPEKSAEQLAAELNARGARVAVNDEGEVVDKRQLLSAGLNVAVKPNLGTAQSKAPGPRVAKEAERSRSTAATSARETQRERQTRMMTEQLEKIAEQQARAEAEEQKGLEQKIKSQKTGAEISSAKERYLARKKEQEAQKDKRH